MCSDLREFPIGPQFDEVTERRDDVPRGLVDGGEGGGSVVGLEPDWVRVGVRIGNAIAAAVFGARGELRDRR